MPDIYGTQLETKQSSEYRQRKMSSNNNKGNSKNNSTASNVRVIARIRPLAKYEISNGSKEVVSALKDSTTPTETVSSLVQIDNVTSNNNENKKNQSNSSNSNGVTGSANSNKRWFEFDAVFDGTSTQDDVYTKSGIQSSIVNDLFQGYNATILAYGQTGAGKTYTMGNANDGLIPRCCQDVFDTIDSKCDDAVVEMSYLEIYNEEIRDLLTSNESSTDHTSNKNPSTTTPSLRLREMVNGDVYAEGLTCQRVTSPEQIQQIMDVAASKRMVAATAMNATSSRSHAMAIITITGVLRTSTTNGDDMINNTEHQPTGDRKFKSKLTLVDLAGSERIKKTGAAGDRRSEGININKSLLVLGQVVAALAEQATTSSKRATPKRKPPYRDSKLTRLLQDSLGGNSRTIMIACVSPADYNIDESINTLRYATTARSIQNTATQNIVQALTPEEVAKLQRENQLLKLHIDELQRSVRLLSDVTTTPTQSPSAALSPKTVVDTATFDDSGDGTTINELKARITELENELKNSNNQDVQLDFQKVVSDTILELPALKVELEQLREDVKDMEAIESENDYLHRELKEARLEAHAAQAAATKLSNIMDKLQELKTDEIAKKRMTYNSIRKEEGWVQLLVDMLSTRQAEMKNLEEDFALVVRVVERCTAEQQLQQQQQAALNTFSNPLQSTEPVESAPVSPKRSYSENYIEKGTIPATTSPRRGWFKSSVGNNRSKTSQQPTAPVYDDTPAEIRQLLLKQHVNFFRSKMEEISECITVEEESIRTIRSKLRDEREEMEMEIGIDEFVKDSLCSDDEDLLQKLTKVLIGPIQRV